jgi:hypothetical protein
VADAAEFRKARELWITLRSLTVQNDALGDRVILEQHEPYAGLEHVLCGSRDGEFWWDCVAVRRIAAEFGIEVDHA